MASRSEILAFIERNPGSTTKLIGAAFGTNANVAATRVKQLFDGGYVTRTVAGITASKSPVYAYKVNNKAAINMTKAERIKTAGTSLANDKASFGLDAIADNLAKKFAKVIASKIGKQLTSELERIIPMVVGLEEIKAEQIDIKPLIAKLSYPAVKQEPKVRNPVVGVVGLLPVQNGEISAEFADCLDLRFSEPSQTGLLKSMAQSCDVVFIHTKHNSHSATEILKSNGANIRLVNGSLSQMKEQLMQFYCMHAN